MGGLRTAKTKIVNCTHCGGANEVAARAMSVFCAHCRKRLILENYVIKSYQAVKGYATCGDVSVEKRGRVAAPIQSNSLTVKGKVNGKVEARGKVEVASTGSLEGSLKATSLIVVQGAKFDGYCEIRPTNKIAEDTKPAELVAPAQASARSTASNGVKKLSTTSADKKTTIATADAKAAELPAKKPSAKNSVAKKTTKKKAATKKVAAKKVTTRKSIASKAATKKKTVKKITTKSSSSASTPADKPKTIKAISTRRKSTASSK